MVSARDTDCSASLPPVPTSKESLVGRYAKVCREQTAPRWPQGLIPLCDWGSAIVTYLDCSRPEAVVVRLDPHMPKADVASRVPAARHYDRASEVREACWVESASFPAWLEAWADGKRLFYLGYGAPAEEEDPLEALEGDEEDDEDE